jgi:glutamine phosphoribosylpyrophosphate amidotransferase
LLFESRWSACPHHSCVWSVYRCRPCRLTTLDGVLSITYDGAICNAELRTELEAQGRVYRSSSDTEVILHGYCVWGEDVVTRLRGMFAFCISTSGADHGRMLILDAGALYEMVTGSARGR